MGGEIQRLVDVEQGIRHLRFIMETGSGVIEELRGDVREVVRLPRVPRGLQHRRGSGCGSGANLQNPFCAAQGGNLRGIAIQTGAGGVVAIQRVGNAMLLVEQQFQRRTLPGEEGVVPGDAGFQILRQRLAPLALRARFLRLRNLAERNAAAPAFTFAD
ncbi:hypothetical protein ExPUPEC79_02198 [Escherichia coli]|nr:hypothetical protein ExPUPEC79_02198 [Escherichia coli]